MRQITIITENQSGELTQISSILGDLNINIDDIEYENDDDHGVITLTVDHYDTALKAIREAGFQAVSQDALIVKIEDQPGALAKVATRFQEKSIVLRSMHILQRKKGFAHVTIVTNDNEQAAELLKDILVGTGS